MSRTEINNHENRISSIENLNLAHFSSFFTKLPSTSVENTLQISSFYAKQSQFEDTKMNAKSFQTTDYDDFAALRLRKNKANLFVMRTA